MFESPLKDQGDQARSDLANSRKRAHDGGMDALITIDSELVELARAAVGRGARSEAEQIADWARLGLALEASLSPASQARLLCAPLVDMLPYLQQASTPEASARVAAELAATPLPRYSEDPSVEGGVIEHRPDGTSVAGRLRGRTFVPAATIGGR